MSTISEIDALSDFGLTLDHFYGLVKAQVSNLQVNQYIQLQAAAIPLDISEEYPWFSYGNLSKFFDVRLDPTPISDSIALIANSKLSDEYILMLSDLLALVEIKELDSDTLKRIEDLKTKNLNYGTSITSLQQKRLADWVLYAEANMIERGDITVFRHWVQGHYTTQDIYDLSREQAMNQALISALRIRKYTNPGDQAIVEAYAAATGPAARMRFPRFQDKEYKKDAENFSPVYFAMLPDNDSSLFANRQLCTTTSTLASIKTDTLGGFSETITKGSESNSKITTDWNTSTSGGWGPFKVSASVSNHQQIKEDFSRTQGITVGAKSIQALPIDASSWFNPDIFKNELTIKNPRVFDRYFGTTGSLLFCPSHLIIARGLNLAFHSTQEWNYDFESSFSGGGGGSASIFGIGFGGSGGRTETKKEQKVERRGHDLVFDDGDNIRILGYVATKNVHFEASLLSAFTAMFSARFF